MNKVTTCSGQRVERQEYPETEAAAASVPMLTPVNACRAGGEGEKGGPFKAAREKPAPHAGDRGSLRRAPKPSMIQPH